MPAGCSAAVSTLSMRVRIMNVSNISEMRCSGGASSASRPDAAGSRRACASCASAMSSSSSRRTCRRSGSGRSASTARSAHSGAMFAASRARSLRSRRTSSSV
jgi:hypothetical protein